MSISSDLDEASNTVKRIEALEYAIKFLKGSSNIFFRANTFLHDGKGTSLELSMPKRILIAQARAELRSRKEALVELRQRIAG